MKITITGSLGNISRPLTKVLVQKGHEVTVISSKPKKQKEIEALGAKAAIGTIEDVAFLTAAFSGADAVYTMLPSPDYSNLAPNTDLLAACQKIGNNYVQAIRQSGVKHVVHLSSVGAHLDKGNGALIVHHIIEKILRELPPDVAIMFMRPTGFYNNLYSFIDMIKGKGFIAQLLTLRFYGLIALLKGKTGIIASNYGGEDKTVWASPLDIAAAIAEELITPFVGRNVRYVASEELTCNQIATILGNAVGKPYLKWVIISDKQMQSGMESFGMPKNIAAGLVEMQAAVRTGLIDEDYYRNRPKKMGKVKMKDFAKEFAEVYNQKQ